MAAPAIPIPARPSGASLTAPAWSDAPPDVLPLLIEAEDCEALGHWRTARERYEEALRRWPAAPNGVPIARAMRRVARCWLEEGDITAAIEALKVAKATATRYDDTVGIAHAINLEGIIARQRGDLPEADCLFRAARTIAWRARDTLLVAMIDQNLGTVANIRGDRIEAKLRYEASLSAYRVLGRTRAMGPLHNNLGMLHTDLRQWRLAESHFREALRNAVAHGDVAEQLRAQANRAELYVLRRKFRKAKQLCRRVLALSLSPEACHGSWVAEAFKHLGVVARESGALQCAENNFQRALRLAEARQDALLTAEILTEMALARHAAGRYPETLTALTQAHVLFSKLTARTDLADVDRQMRRLEVQFLEIVARWGQSIESADSYTQGHCQRVADLACGLANDAGVDQRMMLWFRMGALLHDVGKLAVPSAVLNKPGALTPAEMSLMRQHPVAGEIMVDATSFPWDVRPMIRHHHERWDGTGYPDQLAGEDIPLAARILCIADVYDALTSTRSYRDAYDHEVAVAIMRAGSGQSFDPQLLKIFLDKTLPALRRRFTLGQQPEARLHVA